MLFHCAVQIFQVNWRKPRWACYVLLGSTVLGSNILYSLYYIFNQYSLAARPHATRIYLCPSVFFVFFFCFWFFLAEAQQNCRHLEGSHRGYHMHMQHTLLLCSYFWIDEKQRPTITSLLDWPSVRSEVSPHCLDDLSILKGSPSGETDAHFFRSLLVPLIFECCWRFADNRRTMRLRCAAETKSVTITFTFTLHYWIFIHWAPSQWVTSWMTDQAHAFWSGTAESIRSAVISLCKIVKLHATPPPKKIKNKQTNKKTQKQNSNE